MSDDVVRRYNGARPIQAPAQLLADAIREVEVLREENARLTLERDYWARARNEWEKSARLLEQENKRLTRERDAAIREAVRYQQERDAVARRLERALEEGAKRREERAAAVARAEAAERERDNARYIISKCAEALNNGASLGERCSDDFRALLPSEIGLHVASLTEDRDTWKERAEAAEAKVAKLREALKPFAEAASMTADGFPDHDIMPMRLGQCRDARTALQETEQ